MLSNIIPESIPAQIIETSLGNPAILSSVGARLLINMKEAGAKGLNEGMGTRATRATLSGMDFAAAPPQISADSNARGKDEMIV